MAAPNSIKACPTTQTTPLYLQGRHAGLTSGASYNAMIAPFQRHDIKGIIWYQGIQIPYKIAFNKHSKKETVITVSLKQERAMLFMAQRAIILVFSNTW